MKRLIFLTVTFLIAILSTQPLFSQTPYVLISDVTVNESDGTALVTIFLNEPSQDTVIVDYITEQLTASESDFYFMTEPLQAVFSPGTTSLTLAFEVFDDIIDENDEDFQVSLINAQGAFIEDSEGIVSIMDNDVAPCISIDDVIVEESSGFAIHTIYLDAISGLDVSIDYITNDNTASAGLDYTSVMGTYFIPAGSTSVTISIAVYDDDLAEADEKIDVVLSNPVNTTICDGLGIVTLVDNDINENPTITCVENSSFAADSGFCYTTISDQTPVFSNYDGNTTISNDWNGTNEFAGEVLPIGATIITWTAIDGAGNTATCSHDIIVEDTEQPSFENLGPQNMSTDEDCSVVVPDYTSQITAWDNCGEVVLNQEPSPGVVLSEGFHEILITATDASGNVTVDFFTLSVMDDIDPELSCQDISVTLNSDGIAVVSVNELIIDTWDNCGIAEIWATGSTFDASDIGENLVEVIGYDYMGNSAFCVSTVTVENPSNGNDQVIGDLDFDMYPNPTFGDVVINKPGKRPGFGVRVMDLTGKTIYNFQYDQEDKIKLDLNSLDSGIYMVTLSQGGESVTKKIIKSN